jgi:hypothetical protein
MMVELQKTKTCNIFLTFFLAREYQISMFWWVLLDKLICLISIKFDFFFFLVFQSRVSLCSHGCPGICSVDQAGLELRDLPASASQVLELKV